VDGIAGPPGAMLPQAIRRFREQRPAVRICLHVQRPDELENAVLEERLQLAIGAFHHSLSGLRYLPLFEEQQNLYCSREHPFFSRQAREPALDEICTADYVGRGYMAEHQRPHGLVFNRSTTAYSMEAIATLVLSGTYIGYLPTHYAAGWVAEGRLRALRPGQLAYASGFHCASRQSAESCASLEDFVAILQAMYPQPGT
jgi:DNA-binding transcriptional LysR family regulator